MCSVFNEANKRGREICFVIYLKTNTREGAPALQNPILEDVGDLGTDYRAFLEASSVEDARTVITQTSTMNVIDG